MCFVETRSMKHLLKVRQGKMSVIAEYQAVRLEGEMGEVFWGLLQRLTHAQISFMLL